MLSDRTLYPSVDIFKNDFNLRNNTCIKKCITKRERDKKDNNLNYNNVINDRKK